MQLDLDFYKMTLSFAAQAHSTQLTPNGLPYVYHISSVAAEIIGAALNDPESFVGNVNVASSVALLHDVIEDTKIPFEIIQAIFGDVIANGVMALTKDKTLGSKRLQMEDSISRLLEQPYNIQAVKLADRITNLSFMPEHWSQEKLFKYAEEGQFILDNLGPSNKYLAERLNMKIITILGQN